MLAIIGALRSHRAQYIVLRSSNTLDPLFLANFLRRQYPEARVVILNSELLFQRGQDALQLNGVMTLSTYSANPLGAQLDRASTSPAPFAQSVSRSHDGRNLYCRGCCFIHRTRYDR